MNPVVATQRLISAMAMRHAVESDPHFRMPVRPRFPAEYAVVPLPDGLIVEGGPEPQVFRGRAATTLLPRLLPLLDGTRTLEEVAGQLPGASLNHVTDAVALLYTRGLLEDGKADEGIDVSACPPEVLGFYRRLVDATRANRSAGEALVRLQSARVALAGPGEFAEQLRAQLTACGFRHVEWVAEPEAGALEPFDLVIALSWGPDDQDALGRLDDLCRSLGKPWLRAAFLGDAVEIGPYFAPDIGRCYRCFADSHPQDADLAQASPERVDMWLSLAAAEAAALIGRILPGSTILDFTRFRLDDWTHQLLRPLYRTGCPVCCPLPGREPAVPPLPHRFEQSVAFPPRAWINPKDHQHHYRVANLELTLASKRYPGGYQEPLPAAPDLPVPQGGGLEHLIAPGGAWSGAQVVSRELLASLLLRSMGVRESRPGDKVHRWAPTGGNLGSPQAYVLAARVDGLDPGFYFYQPFDHALVRLGEGRGEAEVRETAARALGRSVDDCAALIVLTGALARVSRKYSSFAYRIIHLDAGTALAQMSAVADALGLALTVASRWDDEVLLTELALDAEVEPVTGVIVLREGSRS